MTTVLTFDSDGLGHCLYTEAIDLQQIGSLEVSRASSIEFNNGSQQWEVKYLNENVLFSDPSRTRCLDWEREYLTP